MTLVELRDRLLERLFRLADARRAGRRRGGLACAIALLGMIACVLGPDHHARWMVLALASLATLVGLSEVHRLRAIEVAIRDVVVALRPLV